MFAYTGDFEVHLTAAAGDDVALADFQRWCQNRGFKCVRIVLARGAHVEQPMATWRRRDSHLPFVIEEAQRCAAEATAAGNTVVRVKVEAAPGNADVPNEDSQASAHPADNYFEHHLKLLRRVDAATEDLLALCDRHAAHLSRNALRRPANGWEQRFVTLRSYGVGRRTSNRQLHDLLAALHSLGEQVVEKESEYCVFDSNLGLDAGWLTATHP